VPSEAKKHPFFDGLLGVMLRWLLLLSLLVLACGGCGKIARGYTPAIECRLRLDTAKPSEFAIEVRVDSSKISPVSPDGRIAFQVPHMCCGCTRYSFSGRVLWDDSPGTWRVIHILYHGRDAACMSLHEYLALPLESDGYRVVTVSEPIPDA